MNMKPILKKDFFFAVKSLLENGIIPSFHTEKDDAVGLITFTDKNGDKQVERVYAVYSVARDLVAKRFRGWFDAIMAEFHAEIAETMSFGDKVMDGDTERTITGFRTVVVRSANGTPRELVRTGVVILDEKHEVMAGDLVAAPAPSMTPTQAVRHMAHTLTGVIEQSKKPGFNADEAYADIKTNYELVASQCDDLAIKVWLKQHLCFGYMGVEYTFEQVNHPYLCLLDHILETGWLPSSEAGAEVHISTLFEMDWYGANDITITRCLPDKIYGTAAITDSEGLYQIAFTWLVETGEEASDAGLPAMVRITSGQFTLPYEVTLVDCDALEAIQEMDCAFGLWSDIINHLETLGLIPGE